jgi:hypothetical protein
MSNEIGSRVRYGEAFWRAHHEAWRDLRRQAVSLRRLVITLVSRLVDGAASVLAAEFLLPLPAGLRCRSENLCRDPAIALEEFHSVAVGILDENGANSEIKRFIGRGDVAPTRLIDGKLIRAQAVRQKQAGDLFEPGDLQGEVPRRVDLFKVGAGRHQVNRKMVPCEKPVWLLFAGREA